MDYLGDDAINLIDALASGNYKVHTWQGNAIQNEKSIEEVCGEGVTKEFMIENVLEQTAHFHYCFWNDKKMLETHDWFGNADYYKGQNK